MKKHPLMFLVVALILHVLPLTPTRAEVNVIRRPPNTGTNQGEVEWSAPLALPGEMPGVDLRSEFSGRLKAGGAAKQSGGTMGYDVVADSLVSYSRRRGPDSVSSVSAQAFRRDSLETKEEQYEVSGGRSSEKLNLDLSVSVGFDSRTVLDVDHDELDVTLASSVTTLMMPTLPVTLSYQMDSEGRNEANDATMDLTTHELELTADGTVGRSGLELEGRFERNMEHVTQTEGLSGGGMVLVTVPTTDTFSLLIGTKGDYGTTRYETGNESTVVSAGGSLGGLLAPDLGADQELEMRLTAARNDSWPTQEGPQADPTLDDHSVTWSSEFRGTWSNSGGFHADPLYEVGWADTGVWAHNASATAGWTATGDTILRRIKSQGRLTLTVDEHGSSATDEKGWGTDVSLAPVEDMSLTANYMGSRRAGGGSDFWSHSSGLNLLHQPHRLLDYGAGAGVTANLDGSGLTRLSQDYTTSVSLKPEIPTGTMVTGLQETFSITNQAGDADQYSQLQWNLDVPLGVRLSGGYGVQWEWTAQNLETEGHDFRHDGRVSLSGEDLPLSLTLSYAFSHGDRGMRHDGESLIAVPIGKGYSLENRFTISHYEEDSRKETPFLLELSVVYVF